jgi:hypothetical protein
MAVLLKKEGKSMAKQIHKKFTNEQVKDLMKRYLDNQIKGEHVERILDIGKTRFFALLKSYRFNPEKFSIGYARIRPTRAIDPATQKNLQKELKTTKKLIDNKDIPIWSFNYSFVKNDLKRRYKQMVRLRPSVCLRLRSSTVLSSLSKEGRSDSRRAQGGERGRTTHHPERSRGKVSLSTIILRAKQYGFYIGKDKKHKAHDREVITNHAGL